MPGLAVEPSDLRAGMKVNSPVSNKRSPFQGEAVGAELRALDEVERSSLTRDALDRLAQSLHHREGISNTRARVHGHLPIYGCRLLRAVRWQRRKMEDVNVTTHLREVTAHRLNVGADSAS